MEKPEPALAADWPKVYLFAANFQVNLRYPEKGMWRRKADDWYTSRVSGRSILPRRELRASGAPQPNL